MHTRTVLSALALALPVLAFAQDPDEFMVHEPDDDGAPLQATISIGTQWHESDNMDFRPLDESSDQAILDSDDRASFVFTSIESDVIYRANDQVKFNIQLGHRGLWGADQLGMASAYGSFLFMRALNTEIAFGEGENALRMTLGRQSFSLGGTAGPEYVFRDHIDGLRLDLPVEGFGTVTVFPIEVPAQASANDDLLFAQFVGQRSGSPFNFQGETMTRRHGAVITGDGLVDSLDVRLYGFYADIGATGTGADISYDGNLGNFSDNDWIANFGARGSYAIGPITPWVSIDASSGIDRKELVATDVNANGFALHAGVEIDTTDSEDADKVGLQADADFFTALGPTYRSNGLMFSHGYVGMKGQHINGWLTSKFMGWHPSSYVGSWGISEGLHNQERQGGTQIIHAEAEYHLPGPLSFRAGFWNLKDTGYTELTPADVETIDPPFGYSRDEFRAQQRVGSSLGNEIDVRVGYSREMESNAINRPLVLDFELVGAVFLPGEFYAFNVSRVAGDHLGGDEMAWAISGTSRVWF